jgi:hypothetical protein
VDGRERFAKIAGGEEAIKPAAPVEEKNVGVAVELAVLEAVVENMDPRLVLAGACGRIGFGELASVEPLTGNVDREAGFAGDEERFVAEFVGGAVGANAGRKRALSAVTAGKNVDLEAALRKRLCESDGERGLAGAAGGEVADADDGIAEAADWFEAGAEAELTSGEGEAIEGYQREQPGAGLLAHADSFLV